MAHAAEMPARHAARRRHVLPGSSLFALFRTLTGRRRQGKWQKNMQNITDRNLRSVDLNLLVIFDALMAERHVTRAARHNGISQPAMSKALNRLRHLLDDPLFERRDGRMEPTPRALDLAGPIRSALSDISRTLTAPSPPNPREFAGTVRIAAIDLHQTILLPALTTKLRLEAPQLDLRIQVADRDRLYDQLADGEIDLAIAPVLIGMPELCAETLWSDRLVTLLGSGNRLSQPMTIEAFAAADHVVDAGHVQVAPDGRGASLVDTILAARGLRRRIAVVLPSAAGVPHCVAATDLIATLPSRIVRDMQIPGLRVIPAPLPPVEVSAHLFWHPRSQNSPLRVWLCSLIKTTAADL
jgi:DNA-binding transcriptional LysR family regulator